MQAPESLPDSVQRTVRGVDTQPTDLEDLLPGSTHGDMLPGSQPSIASIRADLDAAENVAADVELHTRQVIRDQIGEAARGVEGIQANIQGYIGNELDVAAKVADKLAGKITSRITNGLTQAYADTVQLGFPVPTIEQVQYGLATGDYLGSMVGRDESESLDITLQRPDLPTDCPPGTTPRYIVDKTTDPPTITGVECATVFGGLPPVPPTGQVEPNQNCCVLEIPYQFPDWSSLPPYSGGMDIGPYGTIPITDDGVLRCEDSGPFSSAEFGTYVRPVKRGGTIYKGQSYTAYATARPYYVFNGHWQEDYVVMDSRYKPNVIPGGILIGVPNGIRPAGQSWLAWANTTTFGCPVEPIPPTLPPIPPVVPPEIPPTTEQCPAPVNLPCGHKAEFPVQLDHTVGDDYCNSFDAFISKLKANKKGIRAAISATTTGSLGSTIAEAVVKAITGKNEPIVSSLINSLGEWLEKAVESAMASANCDRVELAPIAIVHAVVKFANQWFAVAPRAALQTLQQAENLACQTTMPDQPSADKAYLANVIDKELWKCWTKINGDVVEAAEKGIETLRTRPTSEQVSKLFRRKMVTEDEFRTRMRENGVIHDKDREAIHNLTQDWPSLSDLTPMLVRDVWDETTIDWTEVDKLFETKYTDETKKYFDAIGLTKDVVKYYWRAHFHLPSFTMASEMYHRFRALPEGDPLRTDLEKVKALLIQDDWHPDWIERMLAITFRPMRLIDIRTAYDMRILDAEGLRDKLRILGYSDSDVQTTEKIWERRRDIRDAKQGGYPSVRNLIGQYAGCEIDDATFRAILTRIVETDEQFDRAIDAANDARSAEDNRRTITGISWQYRRGLISEEDATAELARQGIDPSCVPSLVRTWKAQTAKQPKQLAAGSLCKMMEQGIIGPSEFVSALLRIGYTSIDADRIMRSCAVGLTQKETRAANREAERLAREQKKAEKEAKAARRLAECGEPPCPASRQKPSQNGAVNQTSPGP